MCGDFFGFGFDFVECFDDCGYVDSVGVWVIGIYIELNFVCVVMDNGYCICIEIELFGD